MPDIAFNEELGRRAFEAMRPALQADTAPKNPVNLAPPEASARVLEILRFLRTPQPDGVTLEARLLEFPAWAFDPAHLATLEDKAWACWYIHEQRTKGLAAGKVSPLDKAEVQAAKARRARMLALAQHHLSGDNAASKELADIRKGNGYADFALDLSRLAALYDLHAAKLSTDATWWRADDASEARREAAMMTRRAAFVGSKNDEWRIWAERSVAALRVSHNRVRDAVRFAWPDRRDLHERFVRL